MASEFLDQREMWYLQLTEFSLHVTEEEDSGGRV